MRNLNTIEIKVITGGTHPVAGFFRSDIAQRVYQENLPQPQNIAHHHPELDITTKALVLVINTGVYVVSKIVLVATALIYCAYLCIKDTYYYNKTKCADHLAPSHIS